MVSYQVTPAGSPLRDFIVRTLLQLVGTGDEKSAYSTKNATDEIMGNADLVRDMIRLTGEQNKRGRGDLSFLLRLWELLRC